MRQTIHGIYLGHINYSDTSVIARFYTKEHGKQSFLIKGVRTKKSKVAGLLQPLNELQINANFQTAKELNTAFGVESFHTLHAVHSDFRKSTIAIFLAEVLHRSIIEEESNVPLYLFLTHRFKELASQTFDPQFHHKFLIELSLFLGFYPRLSAHHSDHVFNLEEGIFEYENYHAPLCLKKSVSESLKLLLQGESLTQTSAADRAALLDGLVTYYEIQLGLKLNSFQSHLILKEVFS